MAEKNENEVLNGENTAEENKTPDETQAAPVVVEFTDTGGDGTPTEQAQAETTEQDKYNFIPPLDIPAPGSVDAPPAPDVADGAEKPAAEQDTAGQEAAADEKLRREQEALLKALDKKADDFNKKNPAPKKKDPPAQTKPPADKGKSNKPDKPKQGEKPPKTPNDKNPASVGGGGGTPQEKTAAMAKEAIEKYGGKPPEAAPPPPDSPSLKEQKRKLEQELRAKYGIPKSGKAVEPWVAPEEEKVVRVPHDQLHSFKGHPFNVEKNAKYLAFVASIRAHGVTQPAVIRPREKGGFEIISGHRRTEGSKDAELNFTPCIVRALNDEQAIQQMVEDNVNNREIGTMELARALSMQLDAIKRQGAREALTANNLSSETDGNIAKRSNQVIAERNGMSAKLVQRYIALTKLTPSLQEFVDGKAVDDNKVLKLPFMPAFEVSYLKPENQEHLAVTMESMRAMPSHAQTQRMRELEGKGFLDHNVIDGIMLEEKKEERKVIITSQELDKYFGADKSPKEMKDTILKLLDEYKAKNPLELGAPEKTDKKKDAPEK